MRERQEGGSEQVQGTAAVEERQDQGVGEEREEVDVGEGEEREFGQTDEGVAGATEEHPDRPRHAGAGQEVRRREHEEVRGEDKRLRVLAEEVEVR